MTEKHSIPFNGFEFLGDAIAEVVKLAGDKIEKITIDKSSIVFDLSEEVVILPAKDVIEHIRELPNIEVAEEGDVSLRYLLSVYHRVCLVAVPRYFVMSPSSRILSWDDWNFYSKKSRMIITIFGMNVLYDDRLDTRSFIICGSSGFGDDIGAITCAWKGYMEFNDD